MVTSMYSRGITPEQFLHYYPEATEEEWQAWVNEINSEIKALEYHTEMLRAWLESIKDIRAKKAKT